MHRFLIVFALAYANSEINQLHSQFIEFKQRFNKVYSALDEEYRFSVFKSNLAYIAKTNSEQHSFKLKVGPFADLTFEEFSALHLKSQPSSEISDEFEEHIQILSTVDLPADVNWLAAGKVSEPKDEGLCESDYIFSSIAAVESARAIYFNQSVQDLSAQQVIDCSNLGGCNGGWGYQVFDYLMTQKCLNTEAKYPYKAKKQKKCKASNAKKSCTKGNVIGWKAVLPDNESQLMAAVARQPVQSMVYVNETLQHYAYGLIPGNWCGQGLAPNHEILITGYSVLQDVQYWVGKNSWGVEWGLGGYFMVERDPSNFNTPGACMIASQSSYPIIS